MERESNHDMEQIQKGLEEFLEREVMGYRASEERPSSQRQRKQEHSSDTGIKLDLLGQEPAGQTPQEAESIKPIYVGQRSAGRMSRSYRSRATEEDRYEDDFYEDDLYEGEYGEDEEEFAEEQDEADMRREKNHHQSRGQSRSGKGNEKRASHSTAGAGSGKKVHRTDTPAEKPRKKRHFWKVLLICLACICVLAVFIWNRAINSIYGRMNYSPIAGLTDEKMKEEGVTNILLIGNDSRTQGEDGRSDAMILLSISDETKTIHMTSLLRDMYVEIPDHGHNRLNAAYAYGGAELLMKTLELNFDIHVNRYVLVNFQAFANLVDAVGGVDLELTNDEVIYVNGYLVEYNILEGRPEGTDYLDDTLSGMIHLNGPQALAYCRIRYIGTDFARTQRQRNVLSAIIKKAPAAMLTNGDEMLDGLLPNLTTNLSEDECRSLSLQATKMMTYEIVQNSIPIQGGYSPVTIDGMSVLEVDFEQNKQYIQENIYGEGQ